MIWAWLSSSGAGGVLRAALPIGLREAVAGYVTYLGRNGQARVDRQLRDEAWLHQRMVPADKVLPRCRRGRWLASPIRHQAVGAGERRNNRRVGWIATGRKPDAFLEPSASGVSPSASPMKLRPVRPMTQFGLNERYRVTTTSPQATVPNFVFRGVIQRSGQLTSGETSDPVRPGACRG